MNIEKNGKTYQIKELKKTWKVITKFGKITIVYCVAKNDCQNINELTAFLESENVF